MLAALFALRYFGPGMLHGMQEVTAHFIRSAPIMLPEQDNVREVALEILFRMGPIVLPFMIAMLGAGLLVNVLQVGILFTGKPLMPKFDKLNPISGFSNLFSLRALVELLKSVFKVGIVLYVTWAAVRDSAPEYVSLMETSPAGLIQAVGGIVFLLWWRIALALLVLGILDYGFQRWQFDRNLMMTVQEAREELKEYEGDPRIKQRIRQIQRRIAMQRMMAEVPKADVIVTNPVRYAIALRYEPDRMLAPVVVAKGARIIANRIREVAVENDVPIVQKPDLARTLYRTVEVGQPVPEPLFRAVAEVLAYVYQIDRRVEKARERQGAWKPARQVV